MRKRMIALLRLSLSFLKLLGLRRTSSLILRHPRIALLRVIIQVRGIGPVAFDMRMFLPGATSCSRSFAPCGILVARLIGKLLLRVGMRSPAAFAARGLSAMRRGVGR